MAKKKKQRANQTSKGERRSINTKYTKSEKSYLDKMNDAWDAWKKGRPTPKLLQKSLGVSPNTLYKQWKKPLNLSSKVDAE